MFSDDKVSFDAAAGDFESTFQVQTIFYFQFEQDSKFFFFWKKNSFFGQTQTSV